MTTYFILYYDFFWCFFTQFVKLTYFVVEKFLIKIADEKIILRDFLYVNFFSLVVYFTIESYNFDNCK